MLSISLMTSISRTTLHFVIGALCAVGFVVSFVLSLHHF